MRFASIFLLFCSFVQSQITNAQTADTVVCQLEKIARLAPSLEEISGMVSTAEGFWVHNDSDNGATITLITAKGVIKSVRKIGNAINYDWEDIASGTDGSLYIGDIGNNSNNRRFLQVYKVKNPMSEGAKLEAEKIEFSYPDQHSFPPKEPRLIYDAEAMVYFNDSLFIFNKNRSKPFDGYLRVYKIPAKPGNFVAQLTDSVYLGGQSSINHWITGADISADGKSLALLTSDKIWLFENFKGSNFFQASLKVLLLNHFSQKEAICFDREGFLFVADELFERVLGGNLYRVTCKE